MKHTTKVLWEKVSPISIGKQIRVFSGNDEMNVDKYENWFVRPHTQEILRLESNQLQTTLYDMSKQKIGIGAGAFHIDDGFIANFLGLTSTYYFIVAEAREENLKH